MQSFSLIRGVIYTLFYKEQLTNSILPPLRPRTTLSAHPPLLQILCNDDNQ